MQNPSTDEIVQRLQEWRQAHPQATFDEIDEEVSRQFAGLQARVVEALSQPEQRPAGAGEAPAVGDDPPVCPQCQTAMQCRGQRGQRGRRMPTRQGQEVVRQRPSYVCPACGAGLWGGAFPPWMRRSA